MLRLTAAVLLMLAAATLAADPGYDQAKSLFDAGDFKGCLAKLHTITPPAPKKGDTAADPRLPYLLLKGEAMLRMKQRDGAVAAFTAAADAAGPDKKARGQALATAALLKQAPQLTLKAGTENLDVVAPESRTRAMAALFEQKLAATDPQIAKAAKARTLSPVVSVIKTLGELQLLELGSGGDGGKTSAALATLARPVGSLLSGELQRIDERVGKLTALAHEAYILGDRRAGRDTGPTVQRGLTTAEQTELRREVRALRAVDEVLAQAVSLSTETDVDAWRAPADQANRTLKAAESLLNTNFKK